MHYGVEADDVLSYGSHGFQCPDLLVADKNRPLFSHKVHGCFSSAGTGLLMSTSGTLQRSEFHTILLPPLLVSLSERRRSHEALH